MSLCKKRWKMEIIILIEKRSKHIETFLGMVISRKFISFKELRKTFPDTTLYNTIQLFIYRTNLSVKSLYPKIDIFSFDITHKDNKILKICRINSNIALNSTKYHNILILKNEKE